MINGERMMPTRHSKRSGKGIGRFTKGERWFMRIYPKFRVQYRQKIRRAKQLIEATLANTWISSEWTDRSYRFFYPLRLFMYTLHSGILFFISLFLITIGLYYASPFILLG